MSELKQKTVIGMGWSAIDNIIGTGASFLIGLFLARLLSPEEFGVIGIITVFVAIVQLFVDSGFSQALIRKKDIKPSDYNTLFFFSIIVACICFVLVYFGAGYVAEFFEQPIVKPTMQVVGVTLILNALTIVQRVYLTRELDFKTQAIVTVVSTVLSGVIGIFFAFQGYGVWSLVAQIVSRGVFQVALLWLLSKWRPTLNWSSESFKEMFHFGYKLLLSSLIDTLFKNASYFVIGKFYSTRALGEYTRASQFSTVFSSNLINVIQKVSYPVLSTMQDDNTKLLTAYRKLVKSSMLISFSMMLAMAAVAKPMILILIGEKWLPAAYFLQIICLSEMFYPLHALNLNILNVKGRSDLFLRLEIIKKIIAIPMILVGIFFSIEAMLWSAIVVTLLCYLVNAQYSAKLIGYPISEQIKDILPSFIIASLVAVVVWSITLVQFNVYAMFALQIIIGIALTLFIYEKYKQSEYIEMRELILKMIAKIFKKNKQ